MGQKTKIDWCDSSWNPIVGCNNQCPYCYARRIANRFSGFDIMNPNNAPHEAWFPFGGVEYPEMNVVLNPMTRITKNSEETSAPYPFGFEPTYHVYRLNEPQQWKEPKRIFVCSMADLFGDWIPYDWIKDVFEACEKAPWHTYYFLTKNPIRYLDLFRMSMMPKNLANKWFGTTITKPEDPFFYLTPEEATDDGYDYYDFNGFLSIEPIQSDFPPGYRGMDEIGIKWIIVGAETGNRVGKVKPEREWIEHIRAVSEQNKIPLFMKESLRELMGDEFIQEIPK